jgi:FkbM family methyltransferase
MLRSLANKFIAFYLLPSRINARFFYYVKGTFFTTGSEHLYWATRYIKRHWSIAADAIIIDVGGYNGETSLYLASEFPGQNVYCIEPNARTWPFLDKITATHKEIMVRKLALGREKGKAVLHVTANNVSSSLNEIMVREVERTPSIFQAMMKEEVEAHVEVSTLDAEFEDFPRLLLIKLDTQGTELDILNGGKHTLRRTKFILTEMNNHQHYKNTCQYHEVDEFLRHNSFRLVDIVVSYRGDDGMTEYDALYENVSL